jgi:CDP-6-deoxy-D-xylo-4-hexulose-3-dehydrase
MVNPEQNRLEILELVEKYFSTLTQNTDFVPGITPVPVSGKKVDGGDISIIVEAALDGWFTSGRFTELFQKELAKYIGVRNALFVNSGSSANLLAVSALTSPKLGGKALKVGDEVITAAMGFPTTLNPIIQNGCIPVLVDVDRQTYNINIDALAAAVTPKTKAIVLAHTLGNPFNLDAVKDLCKENNLYLVEDTCDALGTTYRGKRVGSFGDIATLSFYPAHHITTGEGGAVLVNSPLLRKEIESFRDWGRDCYCDSGVDDTCKKRFGWQLGDLPFGYDHKYIYSNVGYNLKATEMQAALGVSQIRKINDFVSARKVNFEILHRYLATNPHLELPVATEGSDPAWFGFPILVKETSKVTRLELIRILYEKKIGTRLMFGGNLAKQPAYRNSKIRISGKLESSDQIMNNAFWVGVHPSLSEEMLVFVAEQINVATGNF